MVDQVLPVYDRAKVNFKSGKGMYIFDADGNSILDCSAGYAALALGHCHPKMVSALTEQAAKLWHVSNRFTVPGLKEYTKRLCDISFAETVFVANTGAEAVECMIKMARRYYDEKYKGKGVKKYRIITFDGAFHGRTYAAISAGAPKMIKGFEPPLPGFDRVPWNDIEAVKDAITEETAGVLIEPIQGEGGMRAASEEFMKELRSICDKNNILLMLDEVQCGMGRTGYMFAHEMYDIKPDIVALGKGIGAGFPLSACLATAEVGSAMYAGSHGSTFGGNPLALAVGNVVLDELLDPSFLPNVRKISVYMRSKLEYLAERYPSVIDAITGKGLMLGININSKYDAELMFEIGLSNNVICMPASGNILRVTPPLIITQKHIDEMTDKLEAVIKKSMKTGSMVMEGLKKKLKKVLS